MHSWPIKQVRIPKNLRYFCSKFHQTQFLIPKKYPNFQRTKQKHPFATIIILQDPKLFQKLYIHDRK